MDNTQKFMKALRIIVEFLETTKNEDIEALLDGQAVLEIRRKSERAVAGQESKTRQQSVSFMDLQTILSRLESATSREAGQEILENPPLTRRDLEVVAKMLSVSITKTDNIEKLREKIVEATVGSRLSSQAIRGT